LDCIVEVWEAVVREMEGGLLPVEEVVDLRRVCDNRVNRWAKVWRLKGEGWL